MTIPFCDDRLDTHILRKAGAGEVQTTSVAPAPRVFILQEPRKRDEAGELVSAMNFKAVAEWGTPVICMPPGWIGSAVYPAKEQLKECFKDFRDGDFVVGVGDTTLIFLAGMVISDLNRGRCKFLKYDRKDSRYILAELDIHRRLGQQ